MAAAIENLVGEIPLHHQPDASERDTGNYREHANDSGPNDGSGDHRGDWRLFELKGGLVPGNLRAGFYLFQQGIRFGLRARSIDDCEQSHRALGEQRSSIRIWIRTIYVIDLLHFGELLCRSLRRGEVDE